MKKRILGVLLIIFSLFLLTGCGDSDSSTGNDKGGKPTVKEQVIYDDNDIKVIIKKMSNDGTYGPVIKYEVINNTPNTISVGGEYLLNGIGFPSDSSSYYVEVEGNSTKEADIEIMGYLLDALGIKRINNVSISLEIENRDVTTDPYNPYSYKEIANIDNIDLKMSNSDPDYEYESNGKLILSEGDVKVYIKKMDYGPATSNSLYLYYENNTGNYLYVTVKDLTVNGIKVKNDNITYVYGEKYLSRLDIYYADEEEEFYNMKEVDLKLEIEVRNGPDIETDIIHVKV